MNENLASPGDQALFSLGHGHVDSGKGVFIVDVITDQVGGEEVESFREIRAPKVKDNLIATAGKEKVTCTLEPFSKEGSCKPAWPIDYG
jgi:hypothetical protein